MKQRKKDLAEQIRRFMEARPLSKEDSNRDDPNIELNEKREQKLGVVVGNKKKSKNNLKNR